MHASPILTIFLENAEVIMKQPPDTLEALLLELSHADESYSKSRFTLVYFDDENEMVKIENQMDYENAIRYAQIQQIERLEVRIMMKTKDAHHSSGFSAVLSHSVRMGDFKQPFEAAAIPEEIAQPAFYLPPHQNKQVIE